MPDTHVGTPLLKVQDLHAWYGESHVLHGVGFEIGEGELVTLLGRNGAGKTTTLKSVMGIVRQRRGSVRFAGTETVGLPSNRIARLGVALCPEERGIFASLDVRENLMLPPRVGPGGMPVEHIFELFPNLKERLSSQGTKLSGGEQQMLAMARALVINPKLLLLDEPLEGLAPILVEELLRVLRRIMREEGLSALVVEQHTQRILGVTDRAVLLDRGAIVHESPSRALLEDPTPLVQHLGVTGRKLPRSAPTKP